MLIVLFIQMLTIACDYYRFDHGYVEFWYQIPLSNIFSSITEETITKRYAYRIVVYSQAGQDSIVKEGIKGAQVGDERWGDYIIDYFPLSLFPGKFTYQLKVSSGGETACKKAEIEIASDTILFACSDLILSRKTRVPAKFVRQGIELTPLIVPEYSNQDTLYSYLEIYGLVPDSLFYNVKYQIFDVKDNILLEKKEGRLKYDYSQVETLSIPLNNLGDGNYKIVTEVFDPALNLRSTRNRRFKIKESFYDLANMKFCYEIQYFVSKDEYKRFCQLDNNKKQKYLKKFWSKIDYGQFEKRLLEADDKFSTSLMKGRDTNQGKFYIQNGPPDEIEYRPMETRGKEGQVWHYESRGLHILFCDLNGDGNYEIVGNLDFEADFTRDIPIRWIK